MAFRNERSKYTVYGALFGISFPVLSLLILTFVSDNPYLLLLVICTAPLFLGLFARIAGRRQDEINIVNEGLEQLVEERTSAIRNLMDVSGQGFLSFQKDMKIRGEYSRACEEILGKKIAGKRIDHLLYEDLDKQKDFTDGLSLFFEGKAKAEVIFDILDHDLKVNGREIELIFKTINDQEILLTLTDITIQKELDKQKAQEDAGRSIILQVINHKKYFSSFIQDSEELFHLVNLVSHDPSIEDYQLIQRQLHTLKGNASFFNFTNTKDVSHNLEYLIADSLLLEDFIDLQSQLSVLQKCFYDELAVVKKTLGDEWMQGLESLSIPLSQYKRLDAYVKNKYTSDKSLIDAVEHFMKVPMSDLFIRFPDLAMRLSDSLGKKIYPLEINGGHFPILPDRYEKLVNSFVHLIRNMLDHGIESPMERESKSKDPKGRISVNLEARKGSIYIEFSDDGAGISLAAIEKKARSRNLLQENEEVDGRSLLKFIFSQDFSTKDSISETSGRGVGLSAVKEEVDRLKGKMTVTTKTGHGCTFKILLPEASLQ